MTRNGKSGWVVLGLMLCGMTTQLVAADDVASTKPKERSNRLAKETSPYLLMHAHNPVDWYPWGPEAFEKAKQEGKLIFLSIGYSSCYWCHVMERKVFMNDAIAKTLNKDFVCIKVDREERPDLDDIYMTALQVYYQAIGTPSSGGWPLSMFLTPDGKPVAGGTYFPPEDTDGNQGFSTILARLTELWSTKRSQMNDNAEIIANETRRLMKPKATIEPTEINDKLIDAVYLASISSFDPEFGGVDFNLNRPDGPKFPTPAKLVFLQRRNEQHPSPDVTRLLDLTLLQMACGGIRDHLGGGFHRYSVDRRWQVPHFEKMLYDQAQLADVYTEAYRLTERALYKQVAEELFAFVLRDLKSPEGGFYSAIDAETNGIEGEYYVWDATEIDSVLGASAAAFKTAYRVKDLSDFEHGNVLRLSPKKLPNAEAAGTNAGSKLLAGSERDEFTLSREKLLNVRGKRKRPIRDDKILTCWNGLMIGALARAAGPLKHPEYVQAAEGAANFVLNSLRDSQGRLLHTFAGGQAKLNAYLDDYAFVVDGLLALHDATGDAKWLKTAKQIQDEQLLSFLDKTNGGFYFTSHQHEELLARTKNSFDGVLPAGNSVSARNLIKLAKRTGTAAYLDEARATIELFASNIEQSPRGFATLALAASELLAADDRETGDQKGSRVEASGQIIPVAGTNEKAANEQLVPLAEFKGTKKDDLVKARVYLSADKLQPGTTCQMLVVLEIQEGWHVNQNPPSRDYLIPTTIVNCYQFDAKALETDKSKREVPLSDLKYPKGHGFKFAGEKDEVMVYEGKVEIRGKLTVPEKATSADDTLEIAIKYQACDSNNCLPPKTIKLTGKVDVAKKGETVKPINTSLFPPAKK